MPIVRAGEFVIYTSELGALEFDIALAKGCLEKNWCRGSVRRRLRKNLITLYRQRYTLKNRRRQRKLKWV